MADYLIFDSKTRVIENIIVWDGMTNFTPPKGKELIVKKDILNIGDSVSKDGTKV